MDQAVGITFDILSLASILVLLVLGMGVIIGMMGIFNLAHGELVLLGATTSWLVVSHGGSPWLGILLAPISVFLIGVILERTIIRRFYARPLAALLATWGIAVVIRELVRGLLGGLALSVAPPIPGTLVMLGATVSQWRLVVLFLTLLILAASAAFLRWTTFGLQVRATMESPMLASASGIRVNYIYSLTFGFGAALAGLAGALVAPLFSIYADLGTTFLVRSFLAVLIGGMGSFVAPIGGATAVGVAYGSLPYVVSPVLADLVIFVGAIIIVRFRPQGLLLR